MYARQGGHRDRGISIPQNYSGNAFSEIIDSDRCSEREESEACARNTPDAPTPSKPPKSFLPINIGSEELIIIGIILLLFQSEEGNDLIPLLLAILFLG